MEKKAKLDGVVGKGYIKIIDNENSSQRTVEAKFQPDNPEEAKHLSLGDIFKLEAQGYWGEVIDKYYHCNVFVEEFSGRLCLTASLALGSDGIPTFPPEERDC